ncbi:hypothetical protein VTL71DRAFT_5409 [Oculimacula yallundae]|uniref:Uncharacterized protein n=1 Tax=Oculimacula yallundae TaxID=86028 RepID=A0ABR4C2P0_9HELO
MLRLNRRRPISRKSIKAHSFDFSQLFKILHPICCKELLPDLILVLRNVLMTNRRAYIQAPPSNLATENYRAIGTDHWLLGQLSGLKAFTTPS